VSNDDDERIAPETPAPEPGGPSEVVSTGRSPFRVGRRPAAGAARPAGASPRGRLVRIGCAVLGLIGLLALVLGAQTASDPAAAQCNQARFILEDEEVVDDGEADDIPCDDALDQAAELAAADGTAADEDEDEDVAEVQEEGTIRTIGFLFAGIGLVQVAGALMTARTGRKSARMVALVGAAIGIVFPVPVPLLGPLGSMLLLAFAVYAVLFSSDARAVFGDPGGPRFLRPRTAQ